MRGPDAIPASVSPEAMSPTLLPDATSAVSGRIACLFYNEQSSRNPFVVAFHAAAHLADT
jgi:hypothetical protein